MLGYGGAVAITGLALTIRFLANPLLPLGYPYVAFFPAVILTTFLFGVRPGALSAILCAILAWYFFIPPVFSVKMSGGIAFALTFYAAVVTMLRDNQDERAASIKMRIGVC